LMHTSWWASAQSTPTNTAIRASFQFNSNEPEETFGPLMEVLVARHPTSRVGILTDQQRHDLLVGLTVPPLRVLIC